MLGAADIKFTTTPENTEKYAAFMLDDRLDHARSRSRGATSFFPRFMARPGRSTAVITPRLSERVEHSSRDRREYVPVGCGGAVLAPTLPGRALDALAQPRVALRD